MASNWGGLKFPLLLFVRLSWDIESGTGMLSIAKKLGVASGTVQRVVRELKTREVCLAVETRPVE